MIDLNERAVSMIKLTMTAKGVTQEDLAERLGITQSAVSRSLSGQRPLSLPLLERYMRVLGARVDLTPVTL